ncbi:hypothetical protein KXD40_005054 [Peronospora effusa]|nr:hypothetical protein KXD40_005054 [Peronospora effusa]
MSSMAEGVISATSPGKEALDQIHEWLFADKHDGRAVDEENLRAYSSQPTLAESSQPTLAESSQPTLAESSQPTLAEPVHATVAEPVITRFEDKSPADFDEVQHGPNVMSGQHQYPVWLAEAFVHLTIFLYYLKLNEAGENFLGYMGMFEWIKYVEFYNDIPTKKSTTVIAALKKGGFEEKTLENMVFSWKQRQNSIIQEAKKDKKIGKKDAYSTE